MIEIRERLASDSGLRGVKREGFERVSFGFRVEMAESRVRVRVRVNG